MSGNVKNVKFVTIKQNKLRKACQTKKKDQQILSQINISDHIEKINLFFQLDHIISIRTYLDQQFPGVRLSINSLLFLVFRQIFNFLRFKTI